MLRVGSKYLRNVSKVSKTPFVVNSSRMNRVFTRSISDKADEVFTKLSDENDPQRDAFFQYSWGSWLKNDKQEKEKRVTRFSLEGLNSVLDELYKQSIDNAKILTKDSIPPPSYLPNLTVSLPHNVTVKEIGTVNPNEKVRILSMASIHEGKHHRIYKIDTNAGKSFVLRIPYALDDENTLAYRLKSEVATMDFAALKLGLKVPKVYSFGVNALNPVRQPFILEEYIEGKLLMRDWTPLESDAEDGESHKVKLNAVIQPLSKFQAKLAEVEFTAFGSLYFAKDCKDSNSPAYENETNNDLKDRWRIGPSVERCFWRKKSALNFEDRKQFLGPWSITSPLDIVKCTGQVEAENARARLALVQAQASPEVIEEGILKEQIKTFDNLAAIAPSLINTETTSIPKMKNLLKPRLYHPDLDPMNVLIKDGDNVPYLLDFEGACIKPYILQNNPQFVAYDGPKIYDLERDIEGYKDLPENEKAKYEFMYKRTRNQYLWEFALNENLPELISSVAPPIKVLRSPYVTAIERKADQEYLLVEESLMQLAEVWPIFAKNKLVNADEYPLAYSEEDVKKHTEALNAYHERLISEPFAATQGWMPQDMFDSLVQSGVLVKDKSGDYGIAKAPDA
ncbi:Altered inheritance of mitochondria protein 9, mitochondrial [Kluyveromyces marxianus]